MDQGLKGNEKIEDYIEILQKDPSPEILSVVLTSIRRRMKEGGQMVVGVDTDGGTVRIKAMKLDDGTYIPVYTSFEQQMKGNEKIMSTFLVDIGQLLDMAYKENTADGIIVNPYDKTLKLGKDLIRIIKGDL